MLKMSRPLLPDLVRMVCLGAVIGGVGVLGLLPPEQRQEQPKGVLLGEHQYLVRCVAFAPDGKMLATAGGFDNVPGEIKLWDLQTLTECARLRGDQKGIYAAAFAPDGRTLATVSLDGIVMLWDVAAATACGSLPVPLPRPVRTVLAPDGRTLALVRWDKNPTQICLWRLAPEPKYALAGGSGPVVFGVDSHRLALWRLATDPYSIGGRPAAIGDLPLSGTLGTLAAAEVWDIPLGQETWTLCPDQGYVWALAFSPDGRTLASGGFDGTVRLWDVESGQQQSMLREHTDQVGAVAFSPDGRLLASGSHDASVKLWDVASGEELANFRGHTGTITSVAFDPTGRWVASASHDRTVRLWPLAKGR